MSEADSNLPSNPDRKSKKPMWIRVVLGLVLVAAIAAAIAGPTEAWLSAIIESIEGLGAVGGLIYVLLYIAATVLFFPGLILTVGSGFVFGLWWGTVIVSAGSSLGALAAFFVGRHLARDTIANRVQDYPRFNAVYRAIEKDEFKVVLLTRLVPLFPFNVINYAFGLTKVSWHRYLAASWLGMIPATIAYVYVGAAAGTVARDVAIDGPPATATYALWSLGVVAIVGITFLITGRARTELESIMNEPAPTRDTEVAEKSDSDHDQGVVLEPMDEFNCDLIAHTHPPDWTNPEPEKRYNMVVIGAGTAGLVTAAAVAAMGGEVALIEEHFMGGDCLNFGCVPSKALLRSAKAAQDLRDARHFGVQSAGGVVIDFPRIMERMRQVRAEIAPHDSVQRFADMGVDVYLGRARFTGTDTVEVGGTEIEFSRACIATGTSPIIPPIDGLDEVSYLNNRSLFELTELPPRLGVIGAGPIGVEMAQAFCRLGSTVTLFEKNDRILANDDADAANVICEALQREGVEVRLNADIERVSCNESCGEEQTQTIAIHVEDQQIIEVDQLLIATGRQPNVRGLGLKQAGVKLDETGAVAVNDQLQTTNSSIYAAGDVATCYRFTHIADFMARIVVRNALFLGRQKFDDLLIPWCTYSDPALAQIGLQRAQLEERDVDFQTLRKEFSDVDRAIVDGDTEGFAEVYVDDSGVILGATIVGPDADNLISEVAVAMRAKMKISDLADVIHPYPTTADVIRSAGDAFNRTRLTAGVQKWTGRFLTLRR